MLLLAAADLHGNQKKFDRVLDGITEYSPHMAILAGDIIHHSVQPLHDLIESLSIPLLVTHGNMDPSSLSLALATPPALDMNNKHQVLQGLSFVGIGDSVPRDIYSEQHQKTLPLHTIPMDILISHRPPKGYQDKTSFSGHIGDDEVYKLVLSHHPRLLLCGHVHENPGYQKIKDTVILNCSVGHNGHFSLVTINDTIKITMAGY
jgi:Icc-related predicted phosphoesterase